MTRTVSYVETRASTIILVMRSTAKTNTANPYALTRRSAIQHLVDGVGAGFADRGQAGGAANIVRILPAALALGSGSALHGHGELALTRFHFHLGHDQ